MKLHISEKITPVAMFQAYKTCNLLCYCCSSKVVPCHDPDGIYFTSCNLQYNVLLCRNYRPWSIL